MAAFAKQGYEVFCALLLRLGQLAELLVVSWWVARLGRSARGK